MSKNTTTLTARMTAVETEVAEMKGMLGAILNAVQAPVVASTPTITAPVVTGEVLASTEVKASKADKASKTEGVPFRVLKEALKEHKANGTVPKQHNGTFVTVRSAIADGLMNEDGTVGTGKASKKVAKAAKKAGKGKGKKAQVVAAVTPSEPAKVPASSGPRRADGSITPKREWALREALATTGLDKKAIDAKVAEAMALLG